MLSTNPSLCYFNVHELTVYLDVNAGCILVLTLTTSKLTGNAWHRSGGLGRECQDLAKRTISIKETFGRVRLTEQSILKISYMTTNGACPHRLCQGYRQGICQACQVKGRQCNVASITVKRARLQICIIPTLEDVLILLYDPLL